MPTFETCQVTVADNDGNKIDAEVDIDFEIYCGRCGAGICANGSTKKTYRRAANRLDIDPCEKCEKEIENDRDYYKELLEKQQEFTKQLEDEIKDLSQQLKGVVA